MLGLLFVVVLHGVLLLDTTRAEKDNYAVVIDAGSTGSRSFVYHYFTDEITKQKKFTPMARKKVVPGLSSFGKHPEDIVSYLAPLLYDAAEVIGSEYHAKTKVFIKATAGMRLIPEDEQKIIWDTLISGIMSDPKIPFRISPNDFGTIDGFGEAYYAVLASNYIAGRIDESLRRVQGKTMIGAMDMVCIYLCIYYVSYI